MPGSDDQYDQVHTYSQNHAGKSKTTCPAVREIGRDGAPVQLFIGEQRDAPRTPPSDVAYLYFKDDGLLYKTTPDGTEERVGEGDTDTRVETKDSGTSLYTDTSAINFDSTTGITVTDDGSGQITVGAASDTDTRVETQDANTTLYTDTSIIDFDSTSGLTVSDAGSGEISVGANRYTDEEAQDAIGTNYDATMAYDDATPSFGVASSGITTTELSSSSVTLPKLDASGGSDGQFLSTDGTSGGAVWQTRPGVTVGASGDYASVQAAHDGETATDIWILPDYSESNDTFPIEVTKEHVFRGVGGNRAEIDLGTTAAAGFEVSLGTNEFPGAKFKNVEIINGDTAIDIVDSRFTRIEDCRFESQASDAMKVREGASTVSPISTRIQNTQFEDAGGHGLNAGTDTHGLFCLDCTFEQNTGKGVDLNTGTNIGFYDCTFQLNGNWGVDFGDTVLVTVQKCYVENNDGGNDLRDISLGACDNAIVKNTYFVGLGSNEHGIIKPTPRAGSGEIRGCVFNDYTSTGINLLDGTDVDVYKESHRLLNTTTGVLTDGGTRTRSYGVIVPQNLSGVTGQRTGDRGIDDGTNTAAGDTLCVWNGSAWEPSDNVVVANTGSVTVTSGGTSGLFDTTLSAGNNFRYTAETTDPGEDVKFRVRTMWDDSAGTHKLEVVDEQSTADYTVEFVVLDEGGTFT